MGCVRPWRAFPAIPALQARPTHRQTPPAPNHPIPPPAPQPSQPSPKQSSNSSGRPVTLLLSPSTLCTTVCARLTRPRQTPKPMLLRRLSWLAARSRTPPARLDFCTSHSSSLRPEARPEGCVRDDRGPSNTRRGRMPRLPRLPPLHTQCSVFSVCLLVFRVSVFTTRSVCVYPVPHIQLCRYWSVSFCRP
ncbi:hypothetical protein EXIGLDRAFT_113815 [Exidia glandulosa HHB12029]|uniref:Uncharacterized protein n=1 Tax=Exidia glandulosa HHB12029 TaxID=1314781 RepID=A0A165GNE9_EXIGL|nr:hypothetical protein EXIGLDRAFT_113815 [Exidia glandulosa HHB12029]